MVRRIHNIGGWLCLQPGEAFQLSADKRRAIRIDFNSEDRAAVHLVDSDGVVTFLSVVDGLQTIEFTAGHDEPMPDGVERKPLVVSATCESPVWYRTIDGDVEHYSSTAESFVKVATRRARNPQLELMMFKQEQNMKRREALLSEQIAAMAARLDAAAEGARQAAEQSVPIVENEESAANDNSAPASEEPAGEGATAPVAGGNSRRPAAKAAKQQQAAPAAGGKGTDA